MTTPQDDNPKVARFRETFGRSGFRLLEPLHPDVNYSFEVIHADPYMLELRADKWWFGETGHVENSSVTLNAYELEDDEVQRETVREQALMERETLLRIHAAQGLDAAMEKAEAIAVANGYLDDDRGDPRLFAEGPEDRFSTRDEHPNGLGNPKTWDLAL